MILMCDNVAVTDNLYYVVITQSYKYTTYVTYIVFYYYYYYY